MEHLPKVFSEEEKKEGVYAGHVDCPACKTTTLSYWSKKSGSWKRYFVQHGCQKSHKVVD